MGALRQGRPLVSLPRAAALLLVLGAGGCRCDAVDEKELPSAAPSTAVASSPAPSRPPAPVPAPVPAGSAIADSQECGPDIGGLEAIASAPAVLLGEMHGLASAPAFTVDLACRLAFSSRSQRVLVAVEIPDTEQPRIDAFLASEGRGADRAAVTAGAFWTGTRDGRSSIARLDMLERIRVLRRRGASIRVRAIDGATANRDEAMAKNVVAAANERVGPVLVLVGNLHARTRPGGNPKWMGEIVRAGLPGVVSLDNRYGAGEGWFCAPDCGRHKLSAQDGETDGRWRVELFPAPDEKGFSGVWRIGPARASEPAVPEAAKP